MTLLLNEGGEVTGSAATEMLQALRAALSAARADGSVNDYREDGASRREGELEWLYEHSDFEITDTVLDFLYEEKD